MSHYGALPRAAMLALPVAFGTWSVQAADIVETATCYVLKRWTSSSAHGGMPQCPPAPRVKPARLGADG